MERVPTSLPHSSAQSETFGCGLTRVRFLPLCVFRHLAQSNTTVMFNMQNMGLYKKFPPEATVLTGFQSFIVHIPNCQQQVDNASRMLRYLQPSGSDVSMDFLVRSAETQDFLDKLKEAHMAPATVLNYIKSMIRFVLYLKTRLEFAAEDPDFDRKCEAYLNLLKALKKPVVKAHGAWKTRSDVLLQGGRSLQSCQRLLHEAKNDMRAIYRTLLQKQHVSPEEKLLFRYYCVAIVILQHFQKPGALEGMTVTEWLSRKTVAGRVCVTFSQQGVSFALSQEEAAMLEQYFLSVRPDYIYTNAEDDGTFFLASRGRPLKGTTNDLSRLHAHYKLPNVTSQEIRRVVKAVVAASCTEEQKFAVDLYMGRSAALNRAPSRTRTLDSTVTTSALLSSLGRYEPSPESPSVHLPLTCEGSAEERSPRAHKRTREEEEEEDGRGRRHWEAFLQRFPVTLSGQQRADAGFPSHFYDKWRNLQFCQRREYLQSKYSSRCPTVEEVAKEISEQGWTANHPHPEDVVSKWRAAEKTPGESERGAIGGETGWKLASRTFVGSRGQRRRRRPARTFKPSQVIVISSVTQVSLEDTG
ncbi:uncharacterized protein [Pempheris klunzingeri]|uniref:uncharacterized protein n=1 Tax=Pempheris klunzingeri TaxID=3127111 RepID=UPI00397F1756